LKDLLCTLGLMRALSCRRACAMQRRMWRAFAVWAAIGAIGLVAIGPLMCYHCQTFLGDIYAWLPTQVFTLVLALCPSVRNNMQGGLNRLLERESAQRAAAGVAGLVGSCSSSKALALAGQRFRSVRMDLLEQHEMSCNTPNSNLWFRSVIDRLHHCDAFISHSWHDDPQAKWRAMQRWRRVFNMRYGHEPRVWIDKFCIDQNNIKQDLRCLPVFLSGCKNLVVFCGTTYLSRLWCAVELFTFVHIGGNIDRIRFEPVLREGYEDEDLESIMRCFDAFDVEQCDCFSENDKDRIVGIIRSAFGDLAGFNKAVQRIFRQAGWRRDLTIMRDFCDDVESQVSSFNSNASAEHVEAAVPLTDGADRSPVSAPIAAPIEESPSAASSPATASGLLALPMGP